MSCVAERSAETRLSQLLKAWVPRLVRVSVSLPLDAEKYAGFRLVRVDVTPVTETTERTEVWTDVAFTFENGRLTFETDVAGLFLLVPME